MDKFKVSILDYLEETVANYPDKIAIKDEFKTITFRELQNIAKKGATLIIKKCGNIKNCPIAVEVDRKVETVAMFFAVLYSGNFYVPIDNETPKKRLNHIFSTLSPKCALSISEESEVFKNIEINKVSYKDICETSINNLLLEEVRNRIIDIDPIYVLFTSGSTGVPKGVTINHKMVIDLSSWLCRTFCFSSGDTLGNQTPFYFDASVKDIYIMATSGAELNIISKKYFASPLRLIEYLNTEKITSILWAASAINLVANSGILEKAAPIYLKKVFFSGEPLYAKQLNQWVKYVPSAKYINLYGPTEATVDSNYYVVDRPFQGDEAIPIGKACENMEVFLLDDNGNITSEGVGEITIRGTGVSMGYYNDEERSNKVFIQDPRQNYYRDMVYKTGDLGTYNEQGEIIFISRKDNQIKHMGNRIELGEIELCLNAHNNVNMGLCLYDEDASKILYIYTGIEITRKEMFFYLQDKLPKYMFPNKLIKLDQLPLTQNGKINRLKLKEDYSSGKI